MFTNGIKATFITMLLITFSIGNVHAEEKKVRIGVLAIWGDKVAHRMWQPTIDYLNRTIPDYKFTLRPLNLKETSIVTERGSLDFIITNPGNYISLETRFGVSRLATLKSKKQNRVTNQFSAIIFTRKDRNDIQSLEDLQNKSFMGVKESAFGGFQMAWLELKKHGINPFEDFSSLQFSGLPQDKIVHAVINGNIDAGTVRTETLERMVDDNLISFDDIKILNKQTTPSFPYIHSTSLYPEWPIAKLKETPDEIAKLLTVSLLKLPENSIEAIQSRSAGWTVPLDYYPVRALFKELNLPPYQTVLPGFFELYWVHSLLFLMLFLQPLFIYIRKLQINSQKDKEKLAESENEWSNALDFLDEPMYMVDLNDRIIRANKAFYKKIGATAEKAIGKVVTDYTHPQGEEKPCKVCQARKDLVDTAIILEADDPVNKSNEPMEISVKVIRNSENKAIGIIQRMRDLTASREAEKTIRRNEQLFKELLDSTPDPLIVSDSNGVITLVNTQFEKQLGYSREEIIGQKVEVLIPHSLREKHIDTRNEFSKNPEYRPMSRVPNLQILDKNNNIISAEISLNPFVLENEKITITTIHDISPRIAKEVELKRLASFPELNPIPVIEFKEDGTISYANPAANDVFPDLGQANHKVFKDINFKELISGEKHELNRNIEINDATYEQKLIYNPDTKLYLMYIWDITKLRNITQRMTYQATHDSLTNLINRREFERRLHHIANDAKVNHKVHSLCYMDLDQFKAVNDSCGHAAGDELLKQLSSVINHKVRETDTFARLGGDEFGVLLAGCPIQKAFALAEEIRSAVENFRFHWDNKTFKVGVSIGLVSINENSGTTKEIQSAADTACYIAKEQGRNRVHIYEADSNAIEKHNNETNWLTRINTALDDNCFALYFQKITSMHDKDYQHYEVLVRMIDIDGNTIPPATFIPAAERFDIMSSIDSWVIENTLLILDDEKYKNISLSINLSGQSLSDLNFMNHCISKISGSNIETSRICFEITETAMIENLSNAIRSISTLRGLGCKIALDDFGSGLSSFAYLKNLPIDYLKIDGSLIKDLEDDPVNITMVNSIIHIAQTMELKTIAEYVENDAILRLLQNMKIDFVQGYGIAKPVPIEELQL